MRINASQKFDILRYLEANLEKLNAANLNYNALARKITKDTGIACNGKVAYGIIMAAKIAFTPSLNRGGRTRSNMWGRIKEQDARILALQQELAAAKTDVQTLLARVNNSATVWTELQRRVAALEPPRQPLLPMESRPSRAGGQG